MSAVAANLITCPSILLSCPECGLWDWGMPLLWSSPSFENSRQRGAGGPFTLPGLWSSECLEVYEQLLYCRCRQNLAILKNQSEFLLLNAFRLLLWPSRAISQWPWNVLRPFLAWTFTRRGCGWVHAKWLKPSTQIGHLSQCQACWNAKKRNNTNSLQSWLLKLKLSVKSPYLGTEKRWL